MQAWLWVKKGFNLSRIEIEKIRRTALCTALTINSSRDDATSIAGPLATGEETLSNGVHQRLRISQYAHGRRGARLYRYHRSLIGEKTMTGLAKMKKSLLQTLHHHLGQPEMEGRGDKTGGV